jgi:hypothetical protein
MSKFTVIDLRKLQYCLEAIPQQDAGQEGQGSGLEDPARQEIQKYLPDNCIL